MVDTSRRALRDFRNSTRDSVADFYRLNHRYQTFAFVQRKKAEYLPLRRVEMTIVDALEFLNTLVDASDPDLELDQVQHLLQTSEAMRRDGQPEWLVLAGFLHDLGKILCLFGEPQWAVVGDTFPVGCAFSESVVYAPYFADNPDRSDPRYNTRLGVYEPGCGLGAVHLSWGHDEYLYHVLKDYLPEPASYAIRFHSFYAWHSAHAYRFLADDTDRRLIKWVEIFNRYDLYSKSSTVFNWDDLRPYYCALFDRYLPKRIMF